ncbi:DUF4405 domain-containing protein [Neobacillus sp. 179-J 1A1 HS]|uniref:DUF4405 domain-containing protein n=1 Tax=Neobacillus driksii TaxID=3035913 RepID=UPI0035BC3595
MKKITYIKVAIDILMAVTFVLFFNKQVLGGLTFHEIAGLAIAAVFFTHVLLNWQWVKKVTVKLFDRKLPFKTKFGYVLNLLLLVTMGFIIISGIFISRVIFPNINIGNERWFQVTHISISFLVLILVAVHVGLHWKWIVNVFKNLVHFKSQKRSFGAAAKVATVILLVFGTYQMYTTNFIMHLQGVSSIFSSQTSEGNFTRGEGNFERGTPPEGFEPGERQFGKGSFPEGFEGKGGQFESPNPLSVIVTYFGIMSVYIILIYYLEKFFMRMKRKKNRPDINESSITSA